MVRVLLLCGVVSPLIYVATDLTAATIYPGYSYRDQAVSELFAIGAPTSWLVVPLFSLSSALLLLFAIGVALTGLSRAMRTLALAFAGSALVAMALWNLFPMHMRGAAPTFTDEMHLILASNPFVLGTLVIASFTFRGKFRTLSACSLALIVVLAAVGFRLAPAVASGQPTPGLGLSERLAQYIYAVWQICFALVLLIQKQANRPTPSTAA